jgi:hypothetical protein
MNFDCTIWTVDGRNLLLTLSLLSVVRASLPMRGTCAPGWHATRRTPPRSTGSVQHPAPAMFGCGLGSDGNDLRADGHLPHPTHGVWDWKEFFHRIGAAKSTSFLSQRPCFDGRANFRNVPGEQCYRPLSSQAIFLTGYFDPLSARGQGACSPMSAWVLGLQESYRCHALCISRLISQCGHADAQRPLQQYGLASRDGDLQIGSHITSTWPGTTRTWAR